MSQSRFNWTIVHEDSESSIFEGTLNELMSEWFGGVWYDKIPRAIIRGDLTRERIRVLRPGPAAGGQSGN